MSTRIYPAPIYGPVHSRRLGLSLGINLLPPDGKSCTFDCIYCECGFNKDFPPRQPRPTRAEVAAALEAQLRKMRQEGALPDVLTFAGNGEPTSHPDFAGIIDDTVRLRNEYCPEAKISVLSNSTFIHRPAVRDALMKVDNNILKLDTVSMDYIRMVDRPVNPHYSVDNIIEGMKAFGGHVIVQTLFMKGKTGNRNVDNTGDAFVLPWLEAVKAIAPQEVMIYTIDRETPAPGLQKATPAELDRIKALVEQAGIPCQASY
ncbi:radical SAM protein [Prevotella sp. KH2C16]|uniref:radical SAM protein n=1 Tax=Prevotella sp. KH2C16 TaxID=1855325 RepID=UPI0008E4C4A0|nr:radical SAM protein [Prevotella sp. KH2C16]SFG26070.1 Radical SAM superfamily protein [Prevotella sp. KH2C16]